jgi:hypothetical protein
VQCCGWCAEPLAVAPHARGLHDTCAEAKREEEPEISAPVAPGAPSTSAPTAPSAKAPAPPTASAPRPPSGSAPRTPSSTTSARPRPAELCAGCGQAIGALQPRMNVGGSLYHEHCLVCADCGEQLSTTFPLDGKLYCQKHHIERTASRCSACGEPATGRLQALKGGLTGQMKFHPACMRCNFCNGQLRSGGIARVPADQWRVAAAAWKGLKGQLNGPRLKGMYDGSAGTDPAEERLVCRECISALDG